MKKNDNSVFEGNIIDVAVRRVRLPNGHEMDMEVVNHPGGAAVVAMDELKRICLLRHYRCVFDDWLWEIPAGKIDHQEPPLTTAKRELQEEAGLQAMEWLDLGHMISSPGVFSERVYLYFATQLTQVSANRDIDEVMELHWIEFDEALQWALQGKVVDAKTVIGVLRAYEVLNSV